MRPAVFLILALFGAVEPCLAQTGSGSDDRLRVVLTRPSAWTEAPYAPARAEAGTAIQIEGRLFSTEEVMAVELDGERAALRTQEDGPTWFSGFISPPPRPGLVDVELRVRTARGDQRVVWLPVQVEPATSRPPRDRFRERLTYPERERYAIIVGIDDYPDPAVPDLKHAEADARAIVDFLQSSAAGDGGLPRSHVHLLTGKEATGRNLRGALSEVLHRATERDVIYLFLAGQVGPEPDRLDPLYFFPHDAEVSHLPGTGLEFSYLRDFLRGVGAHQIVLLADSDRSGLIQQENRRGVFANVINDAFTKSLSVERGGLFVLTASEGTERSRESTGWGGGHGIFTWAVLQGLKGGADDDRDGLVTLSELQRYVRKQVPQATGGRQVPAKSATSYDHFWPVSVVRQP